MGFLSEIFRKKNKAASPVIQTAGYEKVGSQARLDPKLLAVITAAVHISGEDRKIKFIKRL